MVYQCCYTARRLARSLRSIQNRYSQTCIKQILSGNAHVIILHLQRSQHRFLLSNVLRAKNSEEDNGNLPNRTVLV